MVFWFLLIALLVYLPLCLSAQLSENIVLEAPFNDSKIIKKVSHHQISYNTPITEFSGNIERKENYHYERKGETLFHRGEFLIGTNVVYVPAPENQYHPSIAFDGTNYMVVWQDKRSGSNDIYGARVNPSGMVLDSIGIPILVLENALFSPSIAFDGTNYMVVWQDKRSGFYDIYGARVDTSGTVLDASGFPISTSANHQISPSIAFDGTNYLVVWKDYRNNSHDIYGARISTSGTVLDTAGIPVSTAPDVQSNPSISFDGTNYMVVWEDSRNGSDYDDIYGTRISTSGTVLDTSGIPVSTAPNVQSDPSISFDGTNYMVVWEDSRNGPEYDIYGTRISTSGTVLDTAGIPVSTAPDVQSKPSISFDGTNYFAVWQDNRNGSYSIYGARIDLLGIVLDTAGIPIFDVSHDFQLNSIIAFDDTNYLVVWGEYRNGIDLDIYAVSVEPSGTVLDTSILISTAANSQSSPSIAYDGTNYMVVWQDYRNALNNDIYGTRVDTSGTVLDPVDIPIFTTPDDQTTPSIAFDGTNYLVVWHNYQFVFDHCIYGARVDPLGTILDPGGILIGTPPIDAAVFNPSIAFDGTNYLVVWNSISSFFEEFIYGTRVDTSGNVLDPEGILISNAGCSLLPSIGFDGNNYLVVWQNGHYGSDYDIYGARVYPSGTVLDPDGIHISTVPDSQCNPDVAFDGKNYLVIWKDHRNGSDCDIYGSRVSTLGVVLDPTGIPISTAEDNQSSPSISFDGTDYMVVWEDNRNGSYDIYGARIDTTGVVIDSFAVSTQRRDQISPALANGDGNQILIAYSGWTNYVNSHLVNTMRIWGNLSPVQSNIQISASEHNFGTVEVGSYSDWTLIIWNKSDAELIVDSLKSDDGVFSIPTTGFPRIINGWDSLLVTIRFSPTQVSGYSGRITIYSNDPVSDVIGLSVSGSGELGEVTIYPNPYVPSRGHNSLYFSRVPAKGKIGVYSISGDKLWEQEVSTEETYQWDTKIDSGKLLPTGFFYYIVKDKDGKVIKKGKFSIIR